MQDLSNYDAVRRQATNEANAAAKALFEAGATEVVVWDCHGGGCNLYHEDLDERCKIALGTWAGTRYPELDSSYAGVLFIGYHAMASSEKGTLAHTFWGKPYQDVKLNGKSCGETDIDAAIAGEYGVPVIFVSGCNECIKEAKEILPWAETVETKKSLANTRIISKHPKAVEKEIFEGVKKAAQRIDEMKPYIIPTPVELEIRFRRIDEAITSRLYDMNGDLFEAIDTYTRRGLVRKMENVVTFL